MQPELTLVSNPCCAYTACRDTYRLIVRFHIIRKLEAVGWQKSLLMNSNSSNDPTSSLMTTSDTSPATLKLQRSRNIVVECATAFAEIKTPEDAYNANVANKKRQIAEHFRCLRELLESGRESGDEKELQDDIVRYSGELQVLKDRGRADAEHEYEIQVESVLQRLSDELIPTIGPAVVKRSLQKLPLEKRQQYVPGDVLVSDQTTAAEPEYGLASKDLDRPHGVRTLPLAKTLRS